MTFGYTPVPIFGIQPQAVRPAQVLHPLTSFQTHLAHHQDGCR